jgi:hypothetical protein
MRRQVKFTGSTKVAKAVSRLYELDFQKKEIEAEMESVRSIIITALAPEVDATATVEDDRKVAVVAGKYLFDFDAELKVGLKEVERAVELAKVKLENVTFLKPVPSRDLIREIPAVAGALGEYHKIQRIKVKP